MQCANSATFGLWCFSWLPLLEKNLKIKCQKTQNKYICFCLNLPLRSHIDPSHIRKIKLNPARDRVEHCIVSPRMELYRDIHEMFKLSLLKYSLYFKIPIDITLWKTNTGQKRSFFFGPKILSKINLRVCNRIPTHSHLVRKRTLK